MPNFLFRKLRSAKASLAKGENKQRVLARLAAGEVVSSWAGTVARTGHQDRDFALLRVRGYLESLRNEGVDLDAAQIRRLEVEMLDELSNVLLRAKLNTNFKPHQMFETVPDVMYKNIYERDGKGAGHVQDRHTAEQHLFQYGAGAGAAVPEVAGRISTMGMQGKGFQASMRPRFASLNFANIRDGSGGVAWGCGVMIFREHVKMRCTFLVGDMFPEVLAPGGTAGKKVVKADANTEKRMTTWDQPYRLIRYMSDNLFRALVAVAGGRSQFDSAEAFKGEFNLGKYDYIEGQVHTELNMARDVERIRVVSGQVMGEVMNDRALQAKLTTDLKRNSRAAQALANLRTFCNRHGIALEIV
jgi:hypothetical protein